jgi:hypothetical protein
MHVRQILAPEDMEILARPIELKGSQPIGLASFWSSWSSSFVSSSRVLDVIYDHFHEKQDILQNTNSIPDYKVCSVMMMLFQAIIEDK